MERREVTDVRILAGMAHPIRYRLMNYLLEVGPRTATQCATIVDISPSACSYHLRRLEEFGLVERAESDSTDRRERPWAATVSGLRMGVTPSTSSPASQAAGRTLRLVAVEGSTELARQYLANETDLPAAWRDAAIFHTYGLMLSPEELTELGDAIDDLVRPYLAATRESPPSAATNVHLSLNAFRRNIT